MSVSTRTFKQCITLYMVLIKHNSLKSDTFFNPIFIPGFSGSRFFRAQVFQGPGFSGSGSRFQKQPCKIGKISFFRHTYKTLVLSKLKQCFYKSCIYGFKLLSLRRVSRFLFNTGSFKLLCDFIQVSEDFSESRRKLFQKQQRAF